MSEYIYDASLEDEHTRLHALEAILDPGSIRVLETIGVEKSWRCLEVGGGGGSIAYWLSQHANNVVATDLDTRFLERVPASNIEVRKHNVVTEPLEEDTYDLVHSRDVLEHIPEREAVLDKMVAALKPGGWLVAEDVDFMGALRREVFGEKSDLTLLDARMWEAAITAMKARGVDPEYGRRLPWRLSARGLLDIGGDVRGSFVGRGATAGMRLHELSLQQLRPLVVSTGIPEGDIDRLLEAVRGGEYMGLGPIHVAAWGRKPA